MNSDIILQKDEKELLECFRSLTERNKGKAELFLEQLISMRKDADNKIKNA